MSHPKWIKWINLANKYSLYKCKILIIKTRREKKMLWDITRSYYKVYFRIKMKNIETMRRVLRLILVIKFIRMENNGYIFQLNGCDESHLLSFFFYQLHFFSLNSIFYLRINYRLVSYYYYYYYNKLIQRNLFYIR